MKINKITFISLMLLVLLLSISFVSASDVNETENVGGACDVNEIDTISLSDNIEADEIIGSTVSVNTFDELRQAVQSSNQVVNLNKDIVRTNEDYIHIKIYSSNITINGNGHKIDSISKARTFIIYEGGELTLNNVKLVNGNGYYGYEYESPHNSHAGGAILNMGKLTVIDCTFENNVAMQGGAIASDSGSISSKATVIIKGTNTFSKNRVINNEGNNGMDGGAIVNGAGSVLEISGKNTFDSNTATCRADSKAGAILNSFESTMKISGENTFTNNQASLDGGAIFNHQATATLSGVNKFINNKATGNDGKGGAINNEDGTFTLTGTNTFDSNTAFRGGAIDNSLFNSVFTISGTNVFKNNKANMGGAISSHDPQKLNIYGENTFTSNAADTIGGAIYSYHSDLNINAKNTFVKNTAKQTGGAIYFADGNAVINGENTFSNNNAIEGGAILLINSNNVQIGGNNRFDSNKASSAGAAIRAINIKSLTLNNHNYFSNNIASYSGGAVHASSTTLNSQGALYESNRGVYGGAIYLDSSKLTANYNIFKYNSADVTGSNIESYKSTITNLNFNYWNSQDKPNQATIHNYAVSNIKNWAIIDLTIPSTIKQNDNTEILRFKTNTFGNLGGEMPDYNVNVKPNVSPNPVVISKNVGTGKYTGGAGQVTISASSTNFGASKTVNVIPGTVATTLSGNDIVLKNPSQSANYQVTLTNENGVGLSGKTISITVDGKKYTKTTNNKGVASLTLNNLANGCHDVESSFSGEGSILASSTTNSIVCLFSNESNTKIVGKDMEMYYHDGSKYEIKLTDSNNNPLASKKVKFYIDGGIYTRTTDSNGKASIAINLNSGKVKVTAYYPGDDKNKFTFTENTVTIKTTIMSKDVTKVFRNATNFTASFVGKNGKKLAPGTKIDININGVFYQRSVKDDGSISFTLNLEQGTYVLTTTNTVTGENAANTVKILPRITNNHDLVKYYKNDSQYTFTLVGDDGKPIAGAQASININGVFYKRTTNENGSATFQINLEPGTYILTVEYKGCRVSNTVKVLTVIETKDVNMKYMDGSKFTAKILNGQGKPLEGAKIKLNINGVLYNRTTKADGTASLQINLIPGQYIITTSYNGLNAANTVTIRS